jgi:hypothetical protein
MCAALLWHKVVFAYLSGIQIALVRAVESRVAFNIVGADGQEVFYLK